MQGLGTSSLCVKSSLLSICKSEVLLKHSCTHLCIVFGSFHVTRTDLRVATRDCMICRAQNILFKWKLWQVFFSLSLLTSVLGDVTRIFFSHFFFWKARLLIYVTDRIPYYIYYIPVQRFKFHCIIEDNFNLKVKYSLWSFSLSLLANGARKYFNKQNQTKLLLNNLYTSALWAYRKRYLMYTHFVSEFFTSHNFQCIKYSFRSRF